MSGPGTSHATQRKPSSNKNMKKLRTISTVCSLARSWQQWVTTNQEKQASEPSGWSPCDKDKETKPKHQDGTKRPWSERKTHPKKDQQEIQTGSLQNQTIQPEEPQRASLPPKQEVKNVPQGKGEIQTASPHSQTIQPEEAQRASSPPKQEVKIVNQGEGEIQTGSSHSQTIHPEEPQRAPSPTVQEVKNVPQDEGEIQAGSSHSQTIQPEEPQRASSPPVPEVKNVPQSEGEIQTGSPHSQTIHPEELQRAPSPPEQEVKDIPQVKGETQKGSLNNQTIHPDECQRAPSPPEQEVKDIPEVKGETQKGSLNNQTIHPEESQRASSPSEQEVKNIPQGEGEIQTGSPHSQTIQPEEAQRASSPPKQEVKNVRQDEGEIHIGSLHSQTIHPEEPQRALLPPEQEVKIVPQSKGDIETGSSHSQTIQPEEPQRASLPPEQEVKIVPQGKGEIMAMAPIESGIKTKQVVKTVTSGVQEKGAGIEFLTERIQKALPSAQEIDKMLSKRSSPTRRRKCSNKVASLTKSWKAVEKERKLAGESMGTQDSRQWKVGERNLEKEAGQTDQMEPYGESEVKMSTEEDSTWIKRPSVRTCKNEAEDANKINVLSKKYSAVGNLKNRWQTWAKDHTINQKLNPFSEEFDYEYSMSIRLQKGQEGYGRPKEGSKTAERAKRAEQHIHREIADMCYVIRTMAEPDADGLRRITFGELFDRYVRISDKVVGILMRARKHGKLAFEGEMLWQGRDDAVIITLLV